MQEEGAKISVGEVQPEKYLEVKIFVSDSNRSDRMYSARLPGTVHQITYSMLTTRSEKRLHIKSKKIKSLTVKVQKQINQRKP